MAKMIKFNLVVDNIPIRTIEELKNNFNIDDILEYYKGGILERWLTVRELKDYLKKVKAIHSDDDIAIARQLINIFQVGGEEDKIDYALEVLRFEKNREARLKELEEKDIRRNNIITAYHQEYEAILNALKPTSFTITEWTIDKLTEIYYVFAELRKLKNKKIYNPDELLQEIFDLLGEDIVKNYQNQILEYTEKTHKKNIISLIKEIIENYQKIFEADIVRFYEDFFELSPLAIFAVLMNKKGRQLFFNNEKINLKINEIIQWDFLYHVEPKNKPFRGYPANEYWQDIEPSGQEFMIIRIEPGTFVRNLGKQGESLSSEDVNGKFPILNGIDYKSNNENHKIVYLPCSEDNEFYFSKNQELNKV
ncbi:MAG: hypothetical protein QNJ47_01215 [Nostocaceae cyanobacterium]|nr:hypothetical protein [Nostocaceae cyanobacterium]